MFGSLTHYVLMSVVGIFRVSITWRLETCDPAVLLINFTVFEITEVVCILMRHYVLIACNIVVFDFVASKSDILSPPP